MKLVVVTKAMPPANALVSRLSEVTPVHAVICEGSRNKQAGLRTRLRARLSAPLAARRGQRRLREVFGSRLYLAEAPPIHPIPHRGWDAAGALLEGMAPDLVVVFGTSLIPDAVANVATVATVNLHTGLAPWYRGLFCTQFAIANDDVDHVGATIHRVTSKIDGGDILARGRPTLRLGDDAQMVELRTQEHAMELAAGVATQVANGTALQWQPQPVGEGRLYLGRDWSPAVATAVEANVRAGVIDDFVRRKARGEDRGPTAL